MAGTRGGLRGLTRTQREPRVHDFANDPHCLPTTVTGTRARAVAGASYVPLTAPEVTALLHELDALLVSRTFQPEAAQAATPAASQELSLSCWLFQSN